MAFVVHFSPFDGRRVSSPNPKKKTPGIMYFNFLFMICSINIESQEMRSGFPLLHFSFRHKGEGCILNFTKMAESSRNE